MAFQIPLPARGHAAAAHPTRPEAVAFARRPGTFAVVLDCATGGIKATLEAPQGRHFYGHGTFSQDGNWLFTTENDYAAGRGCVGDVASGYGRAGDFDSGGIGPHDIRRLPGTDMLVIANGGIDTHPDSGRTKLNIPTMRPNLAYIKDGRLAEIAELPRELHKNSIRHLAVSPAGDVAFGMQWQGERAVDVLVGRHRRGGPLKMMKASSEQIHALNGYIGSVAYSNDGQSIAATAPRGGLFHRYDVRTAQLRDATILTDVCGVAAHGDGFTISSGTGVLRHFANRQRNASAQTDLMWDNHLVALAST